MSDNATLAAFKPWWERLGSVASRLGRYHGNSVLRDARRLRDAGLVESKFVGGNLKWRLKCEVPPAASNGEAVPEDIRFCNTLKAMRPHLNRLNQ